MSETFETAGKIENGNRVWCVRAGSDGIGLDLFHVYAPTMDAARESASTTAKAAGFVFGDAFTVHALRDGEPIDWFATLGHNVVTDRPAVDFDTFAPEPVEPWHGISHDEMDAAADLLAGLLFLAVLSEIADSIETRRAAVRPVPWYLTPEGSPEREAVRLTTEIDPF